MLGRSFAVSIVAGSLAGAASAAAPTLHGVPVGYGTIADGAHVSTVARGSRSVACGVIPGIS